MIKVRYMEDLDKMDPYELAFQLRMWANSIQDFKNNYDAQLLLKTAKSLDKLYDFYIERTTNEPDP